MPRTDTLSKALLAQGIEVRLPTCGSSMYPGIAPGDRVTVAGLGGLEPVEGDILLVAREGRLWCHRLVRAEGVGGLRRYWTRGDALEAADEPVTADQIVGKVLRVERARVSAARRALLLLRPVLPVRLVRALLDARCAP